MPRSGPLGTATPPPGLIPKSPGDIVPSAAWNGGFQDLYNIANTPQPIAYGGTGKDTAVGSHDALTVRGTAIASATNTDLSAATGDFVHITGTTTITGLGTASAGVTRKVVFDAALTLTHNATSLILPGAANIVTGPGDTAIFVSEGSGNWRCASYQRAAVVPDRPQAYELISTATVSGATAAIDFTGLSAYRRLRISGNIVPETDNVFIMLRTSTNNGTTYDSSATNYSHVAVRAGITTPTATGAGNNTTGAASGIMMSGTVSVGALSLNEGFSFTAEIHEFNQTLYARVNGTFYTVVEDASILAGAFGGTRLENVARNAIRIVASSGNILRGFVTVEGIRG